MSKTLLLTSKPSDSLVQVQLHPLVILTISDYVTRHVSRQLSGPIAGAIIGAQSGRDVTMEHAFECKLAEGKDGSVIMDEEWFGARLQQYRDVHKATSLDLVGWFTLTPPTGPEPNLLPMHAQILSHNESALLLAFHPQSVAEASSRGGKLPLTIYESIYDNAGSAEGEDRTMQEATSTQSLASLRFRDVSYTIETGEAEMIAVDFVARGGANATASADAPPTTSNATSTPVSSGSHATNGNSNNNSTSTETSPDLPPPLSAEDDDTIASLTAKANAIRMLRQRLALMRAYIASLPPCYLTTPAPSSTSSTATPQQIPHSPQISHPVLRAIASLLARLPLLSLSRADAADAEHGASITSASSTVGEKEAAAADSALVGLLGAMGGTLRGATEVGRKAGLIDSARAFSVGRGADAELGKGREGR